MDIDGCCDGDGDGDGGGVGVGVGVEVLYYIDMSVFVLFLAWIVVWCSDVSVLWCIVFSCHTLFLYCIVLAAVEAHQGQNTKPAGA